MLQAAHCCLEAVSREEVMAISPPGYTGVARAEIQAAESMGDEIPGDRNSCGNRMSPVRSVASIVRRSRAMAAREARLHDS